MIIGHNMVTVRMMDDSWIINRCVSEAPFVPQPGIVWSHADRCSRLLIPGDRFEETMKYFRDRYGNAAVIAWDGDLVLGHVVFVPATEARKWKMLHSERMTTSADDEKTLIVEAVGFCSIGGREYRGRGIGRAMVEMMLEWAGRNGWNRICVFGAPSGLFPGHWLDSCMPPAPFWEKFGFIRTAAIPNGRTWEQIKNEQLADDPRHSSSETKSKQEIVKKVERGLIAESDWSCDFDLGKLL